MALTFLTLMLCAPAHRESPPQHRWLYCSFNLWVDANVNMLDALFRRACKAGYTGVLLSDSKFGKLAAMDDRYFRNVDRIKRIAAECKLDIIPAVFALGYSESILWHDPNLAEALPVRDALFVVRNGVAKLVPDPPVSLPDFRDLKAWDWKDDTVAIESAAACVKDPQGKNARIVKTVAVHPFRQYHVSVRVCTRDFAGTPEIKVLANNRSLVFSNLGVKQTQDWTEHHAVFNSLEHDKVAIYFGCWDGRTGTLGWKDPYLEEVGLLNVVRRDGAPLTVRRDNGETLREGTDFDRIIDPRMGTVPWNGAYKVWHAPPIIRTPLPDGTRLRISYYHVVTIYDGQVMICPSEPRTLELLRDEARRVHAAWGAKAYMMSHDEIRVLNWDGSCARRKLSPGEILADNVKTCINILDAVATRAAIYVWSDMLAPPHNAVADYYLVRGDLAGSWKGLDPRVGIVVWNFDKRDESLKWFAQRRHPIIIAGYYDGTPQSIRDWLASAGRFGGVSGVMYTTWRQQYADLEEFARHLRSDPSEPRRSEPRP